MRLDHEFTVPVSAAQAWPILLDIDRIAPCMPGATITKVDGDDFEGTVKVKVGPITVTYGGTASFIEKDESRRIAVLEARGRETRGSGTATATVTAQIVDEGESSARVSVSTDLSITGKPAQFGRGVMNDVGGKLLGRFADCLAGQLAGGAPEAPAADAAPASVQAGVPAESQLNGSEPAGTPVAATSAAGAAAGTASTGAVAGTEPAATEPAAATPEPATASSSAPASVLDAPRHEAEPIDLMEAAGGAVAKRVVPAVGAVALIAVIIAILRRRR
jgi:carbon monoxide dehydrogenase subunit G